MASTECRPHAVAVPFPMQGHTNPMLYLCKHLASKGFVITFITTESNQESLEKILASEGFRQESLPDGLPVPTAKFDLFYKDNRSVFLQAVDDMEVPFEKLLNEKTAKQMPPVSCIISDVLLQWPSGVAERFGVPSVVLYTANATSLLLDYYVPLLISNGDIPVEDLSSEKLVTYVPGLSPLPIRSLPYVYHSKDASFDPGFVKRMQRMQIVKEAAWVLINSVDELEHDALEALKEEVNSNSIGIGPLVPGHILGLNSSTLVAPSLWTEETECLTWLNNQAAKSILFISFGSIATVSVEQFEELADGLEALEQGFLWVIRSNLVTGMSQEYFDDFKRKLARKSRRGITVSWAPQIQVLSHCSIGGFLTHCGWNSVLESICCGVPMLCWPLIAEQHLNSKLIVSDWKVGLDFKIRNGMVDKHEVVDTIAQLMSNVEIRKNVEKLRNSVKFSLASTNTNLHDLVNAFSLAA